MDFTLDVKQLQENIVSLPKTWRNFSELGLEVISPQNTHLIRLSNKATHTQIRVKTPESVELMEKLEDEHGQKITGGNQVYFDRMKNIWRCNFAPDREGLFKALILAQRKFDPGSYTSAVSFKIEARQVTSLPMSYPHTWPLF